MTETVSRGQDRVSGVRMVKSADRILALLEYLTAAGEAKSLRNVSDDLDIPRASAYALLMTLQRRGWVESTDNRFRLGLGALRAAAAVIEVDETVHATQLVRQRLAAELQETVHLARLDGLDVVYLQSLISPHSLSVVTRPGRRLAAWHAALGKALLAERPWHSVSESLPKRLVGITPHSITSRSELRLDLECTAQRKYAIDDEENTIGLRCFAIAVPMAEPPIYAISVSVPTARLNDSTEARIIEALLQARQELQGR
jgi:DNA-binding IclR family transcriptional regulator